MHNALLDKENSLELYREIFKSMKNFFGENLKDLDENIFLKNKFEAKQIIKETIIIYISNPLSTPN